jgi:hypothetical protein
MLKTSELVSPHPTITREDPVTALRAFHAERNPRLRGQLFRQELSPRLDAGETLPVTSALKGIQAVGTLAGDLVS